MTRSHWIRSMACLIAIASTANANTTILPDYASLLSALNQGDTVRGTLFLNQCKPDPGARSTLTLQNSSDLTARINFNNYIHVVTNANGQKQDTITTSYTTLVEREGGDFWDYFVRYRFFNTNSVELYIAYFDPITNQRKLSTTFNCHLSNGKDTNAIVLYDSTR